jgi:type I restriction enzyme, S subunit
MRGELQPGYKQTEVGVFPEDWEIKPIGDLVSISVGRDLIEENYSAYQDDTFKYPVFSNTVVNGGLYGFYKIPEYNGDSLTVVGRGVGLGTAFKRSGGYGALGRLLVLFPDETVDATFLTEYINHRVRFYSESGGIPQLTGISIAKYRIPLPPTKAEQEAVAEALSDGDALIESLEQLIAKKRQIKQGAMQELLTGKKRLPGFATKPGYKRTEVGVIPGDWGLRLLGEVVTFLDGKRRPVKDADRAKMRGSIPYYGASGIVDYVNDYRVHLD